MVPKEGKPIAKHLTFRDKSGFGCLSFPRWLALDVGGAVFCFHCLQGVLQFVKIVSNPTYLLGVLCVLTCL